MKRWCWFLPLLFITSPLFAAASIFNIPNTDQSQLFLMQIFGRVGGVLAGTQTANPLKDAIFYFNNIILVVGGLVILYSTLVSTINTAHDGEVLGKKWSSVWIPIRSALGFALLLPLSGGYSVIQGLVMWVVLQGVGGADYIWLKYANGVANGTYLTVNNNAFTGASGSSLDQPTKQIFNNLFCAQTGKLMFGGGSGNVINVTNKEYQFNIPGMKPDGVCGSVARPADTKVDKAMSDFINQINTTAALPYAQAQYQTKVVQPEFSQNYPSDQAIQNALQAAAWQYNADISALATESAVETGGNKAYQQYIAQFKLQAEASGWIYAGAMYLLILNIQKESPQATTKEGKKASQELINSAAPLVTPYDANTFNLDPQDKPIFFSLLQNAQDLSDDMDFASPTSGVALKCETLKTSTKAKDVMKDLTYDCNSVMSGWLSATGSNKTGNSTKTNYAPILNLAQWGQNTVSFIMWAWVIMLVAVTAGATGNIILAAFGFSGLATVIAMVMASLMAYLTPIVALIMSIYWTNGTIAGYYIPMLPFIIYTATAVGWLMLVVEAMVAAPLLALGIVHPEGRHDIMGGAEAGFQLLVGVFLRPMLMVVGFIASGVVVTVIIDLINAGFSFATTNLFATGKLISLWTSLVMLMMYMSAVFTFVNRGFSLIYQIPDRVLNWVGITTAQTAAEDVQTIRQGAEKTADIGAKVPGQAAGAIEGGGKAVQKGIKGFKKGGDQ